LSVAYLAPTFRVRNRGAIAHRIIGYLGTYSRLTVIISIDLEDVDE
jgi:hypothetical protein